MIQPDLGRRRNRLRGKLSRRRFRTLTFEAPTMMALALLWLAGAARVLDIFVIQSDDRLGELVVSKSMIIALIVAYVWAKGGTASELGIHRRQLRMALLIGGAGMAAYFSFGYGFQLLWENSRVVGDTLAMTSLHPTTGIEQGLLFTGWLAVAHLINASADEGLFRGIILRQLLTRYSFWHALLLQAALFAAWHVVWPVEGFMNGQMGLAEAVLDAISLLGSTALLGIVLGYMAMKTGSLWAPFVAHTINNTAISLLYIRTDGGLLSADELPVFAATYALGMLALMIWTKRATGGLQAREARPVS